MGVLLNNARTMARDGVLSSREVGQLVSKALVNGSLNFQEVKDLKDILTTFGPELTPDAKKAIGAILSNNAFAPNLAGVLHGLNEADADKLEKASVTTESHLLMRGRTPAARARLATDTGLPEARITTLVEQADLSRARGVGAVAAALIHGAGTTNLPALAAADPATLRRKIGEFMLTPEGQAVTSRRPTAATITKWIDDAKKHPLVLQYNNNVNAPTFTVAQFEALSQDDRAQLLLGQDVQTRGGALFVSSDLTWDITDRSNRIIKADIDALEAAKIDGSYSEVTFVDVEVARLGGTIVGYVAIFDAYTEAHHEAGGGGSGTLRIALDKTGKTLGQSEDWYEGSQE